MDKLRKQDKTATWLLLSYGSYAEYMYEKIRTELAWKEYALKYGI